MKKISTVLLFICIYFTGFSQNVGIGTNFPNPSALLDLSSNNKGVLFPKVYLNAAVDNASVPQPATGLVVYNTNNAITGGTGLFYNSGTAGSPNWAKVGDLKFPYTGATSSASAALYIMNYGATAAATGIKGYSENGKGIEGISNNGTGVYAQSYNGNALEVNGDLKIYGSGQLPAQGKVLTSDANGNATWQGGIAFASYGIQPDGARSFSDDVEKKVAFYSEEYDIGNNYNASAGSPYSTFTAPVKGIYHFDVKTTWDDDAGSGASQLSLKTTYNGVTKYIIHDLHDFDGKFHNQNNINTDIMLEAGTQVFVTLKQGSGSTINLIGFYYTYNYSYFTGRLVMKL